MVVAVAIGQQAKMPDAYEPAGQDMKQEAANELLGLESHPLWFVSLPIVFPAECDLCVLETDQTVIGYGNPVRIAAEIVQHLIRAAKGRFRVDHPFGLAAGSHPGFEVFRISQWLKGSVEFEFAGSVGIFETVEEQAAEKPGKNAHGEKEAVATGNPAAGLGAGAPARHDAMEMGVVLQVLPPSMEHGQKADVSTQVLGIGGDDAQRGGRGAKQDAVDDFLVLQGNSSHRVSNGEDDVKIGNRQQLGAVLCQPFGPGQGLTLVAVAIGAGVVTDPLMAAAVALVHM